MASLQLDDIISTLESLKDKRPGTPASIQLKQATALVAAAEEIILSQPVMLDLDAPINVVGDIHGQYQDLLRLFEFYGLPPKSNYLFLGDYVDRGPNGLEVMFLLMALKIKFPDRIWLLRGNHESASINRIYGFYEECRQRYEVKLWSQFQELFSVLPLAAIIAGRVFCVHGGLSPSLISPQDIGSIERPIEIPDAGLLCDALWSDPDKDIKGWAENERGVSYTFGPDRVENFISRNDLDLVVRAHQVVENGYEFFAGRKLVTIFSAPNYCGEFDNCGALMRIDENLQCSFKVLKPVDSQKLKSGASKRPATPPRKW